MLPSVSLPDWADFLAMVAGTSLDDQALAAPWARQQQHAVWFSRAAWALERIVSDWRVRRNGAVPTVWLPDYFCNQSTAPMRDAGARLEFYPITRSLVPDWPQLAESAKRSKPDLFVLVHYFGHAINPREAFDFCIRYAAELIEDASHVLAPHGQIGRLGKYVFFSPYKLLSVPDGGLLLVRNEALDRTVNPGSAPSCVTWAAKRLVQKAVPGLAARIARSTAQFDVDPPYRSLVPEKALSPAARRLIGRQTLKFAAQAEQRRARAERWRVALAKRGVKVLTPFADVGAVSPAPYRQLADFGSLEAARQAFESLIGLGCPVGSWPDMAPEVVAAKHQHETAMELRRNLVLLPVHADMDIEGFVTRMRIG